MDPELLGFPEKFTAFRPAQEEAIEHILTSERRFCAIGAPPGVGKSGIAYAAARLFGGRTVILTATRGLQDQYLGTRFERLSDVRGRSNYRCWEGGSCEDGLHLGCGDREGCPAIGAGKVWRASDVGTTNYAYWLAAKEVGEVDTLILDEAHLAPDWLSASLDFHISERECREADIDILPLPGEDFERWQALSGVIINGTNKFYEWKKHLAASLHGGARERASRELKKAAGFLERAQRLTEIDPSNWVIERTEGNDEGRVWKFSCVWPGRYKERLFKHIPRVILMSATLRPKLLGILGIKREDCDFREWGRQFPLINGPVIWVPTAKMSAKIKPEAELVWMNRIGEIMDWGRDRRGLVHTVSFARAKQISEAHGKSHRLYLNGAADPNSGRASDVYQEFLHSPMNSVLVSPSFSTGWDFEGEAAEWQIIAKIAFPDTRSKVMQARTQQDPGYGNYLAAQELVQGSGRIVRSEVDRGVTFLIDDQWNWFRAAAADHLPKWFKVRREETLPRPLEKI